MENRLLTLVRHAKSSWNVQGQQDHERPLNERGMRDAPVMAQRLLDRRCIPDLILCSSAVRTQQTAQYFLKALELSHDQLWVEPKLYLCSPETILNEVAVAEAGNTHVMVIAHNPGLEQLCALLSSECQQAMPTLGIRHFACKSLSHIALHATSSRSTQLGARSEDSVRLLFQDTPKNPDYG